MVEEVESEFNSRIQYQTELVSKLAKIYKLARENIEKSHKVQSKHYNKRHKAVFFQIGDLVMLKTHYLSNKLKKFTKKLAYRWDGVYKISKVESPVTYELQGLDGNCVGVHNVKNLKLYFDRPAPLSNSS